MQAVVWIEESTWEACVDQARGVVPTEADVTLIRLGPKSLGREARYVVDHAPCGVVLGWPGPGPAIDTIRLPPHLRG